MQLLHLAGYGLLAIGGWLCALNFYLSFLRYPFCRLFGQPHHWVSGIPVFGSLLVLPALCFLPLSALLFWLAVVLAVLDTGGLHWFAGIMFWHWLRPPRAPDSDHTRTA